MKTIGRIVLVLFVLTLTGGATFYFHPLWPGSTAIRMLYLRLWREVCRVKYVDLPAGRIHYDEVPAAPGTAGTPLAVYPAGLGARAEDWSKLMPGLAAQGFHVYAPDLLGYGRSAKPNLDYSIPFEEAVVLQFMQAMPLKRANIGGVVDGRVDRTEACAGPPGACRASGRL